MKQYFGISAFLISSCVAFSAAAEPIECRFDSWKGADNDEIVISWVGLGFIADAHKGTVQVRVPDGYYPVERAQIAKAERFTGFVYYLNETASDGSLYRNRYSFRLYKTGKCEARVDKDGYLPMIATGRTD